MFNLILSEYKQNGTMKGNWENTEKYDPNYFRVSLYNEISIGDVDDDKKEKSKLQLASNRARYI